MYFDKLDLNLWKEVQDRFSKELNLHIYVADREGNEVVVSGERPFLMELIKSKRPDLFKERNYRQINELDETKEAELYNFYGVVNLIKPVILHDKMIGAIVFGPMRSEEYNYGNLAPRIGVEENELIDTANEIKPVDNEKLEMYKKIISILATLIPKLAHQKQSRDKQLSELKTLYSVIRTVNSTLELDKVLKNIMNFLVNSLNATDCSVFVYGEEGEKKYCLKEDAQKMASIEKAVSQKAIEEKKLIVVKDVKLRFGEDVGKEYNSMLSIPLKLKEEIIGTINLYGSSADNLSEDDLNFISVIADQVAIAVANAQRFEQVKELAVVDKLTGMFNRRYFTELIERYLEEGLSVSNPIGLVLLDIDNFGKYNNTHGHPQGDELLKEICGVVKNNVRKGDIIGRYGGEEFMIMMPKATPQEALEVAEKIKNAVAEYPFYGRETQPNGKVTVSLGLLVCRANISLKELLKETDDALYKAKNSGKNKVVQKVILAANLKAEFS